MQDQGPNREFQRGKPSDKVGWGLLVSSSSQQSSLFSALHDAAGSTLSTTEGSKCVSTHRQWWCYTSLTAGSDRSSCRDRGSDGASRHGQTHSSCPRATTRLITADRRVDTVELTLAFPWYWHCQPSFYGRRTCFETTLTSLPGLCTARAANYPRTRASGVWASRVGLRARSVSGHLGMRSFLVSSLGQAGFSP